MSALWKLKIRTESRPIEDLLRELSASRKLDWEVLEIIKKSGVPGIDAGEHSFIALFGDEFDDGHRKTIDVSREAHRLSYRHPKIEQAILLGLQPQSALPARMSVIFHPPVTVRSFSSEDLRPRMIALGENWSGRYYASAPRSDPSGGWYINRAFIFESPE